MIRIGDLNILCPVCGKEDWCLIDPSGKLVICPRVPSDKLVGEAGYLHKIDGKAIKVKEIKKNRPAAINWEALVKLYKQNIVKYYDWVFLSRKWNVKPFILNQLDCGWNDKAYTLPLYGESCDIVGIQRIYPNGDKRMIRGSRIGIFVPTGIDWKDYIIICEGASDTATAIDIGFPNSIGRLSCSCGNKIIKNLVATNLTNLKRCVIIADRDNVGIKGAKKLQSQLQEIVDVKIIIPEEKDLREWVSKKGRKYVVDVIKNYL